MATIVSSIQKAKKAIEKLKSLRPPKPRPGLKPRESARERYIAKTGKKGQKGPLARILSKSRTGKPSPHVDPKPRKPRMTSDDYKKFLDKYTPKKIRKMAPAQPGKRKAMKKGGPVRDNPYAKKQPTGRSMDPVINPKRKKFTTDFHKSKAAAAKDKGKANTPGEKMRTFKGKVMAGQARTKKVLRGGFDIGKKIRYQRRGK